MAQTDYYKDLLKRLCEHQGIYTCKPRFENIEDLVVINLKNSLKEGVDLEIVKIINIVYQTVVPLGIGFDQQLYLYPNGNRLDRIAISFEKADYDVLNKKLETGEI